MFKYNLSKDIAGKEKGFIRFIFSSGGCLRHTMYLNAVCKDGCRCQHASRYRFDQRRKPRFRICVEIHVARKGRVILLVWIKGPKTKSDIARE